MYNTIFFLINGKVLKYRKVKDIDRLKRYVEKSHGQVKTINVYNSYTKELIEQIRYN